MTYLYLQSNLETRSSEPSLSLVFLLSTARSYFIRIRGRLCPENKLKQFQPEKPLDFDVPGVFTRACWFSCTTTTPTRTWSARTWWSSWGRECTHIVLSTIYDWLELNHSSRIAPHKAAEDQTMRQLIYKLSAAAIISPSQSFIQHPQLKVAGGCPATLWFNR